MELDRVAGDDFHRVEAVERASQDIVGHEVGDDNGMGMRMRRSESNASEFEVPGNTLFPLLYMIPIVSLL